MIWQTYLGRCIHISPSGYAVYQNCRYRWLTLGSQPLQTVLHRKKPQKPVLNYIRPLTILIRAQPNSCCLLGLGGAGVVHFLSPSVTSITAVDNDKEVLNIAHQFFMLEKLPHLNLVHQNAAHYVKESSAQFFHLLIDLFDAKQFPLECLNTDFFMHCAQRIEPGGFLSVNLANAHQQYSILKLIKEHFRNTIIIPVKKCSNCVVIATNHLSEENFLDLLKQQKEIKKIMLLSRWGYVGVCR